MAIRKLSWLAGLAVVSCASLAILRSQHRPTPAEEPDAPCESCSVTGGSCPVPLPLEQPEREYLWQVEHHGLLLGKFGFRVLADALSRGDRQALETALAADFAGEIVQQPDEVRLDADFAQVVRLEDAGRPRQSLTRDQFLDRLFDYRRSFTQPPQVQLALMGLSPQSRDDLDGLWQGSCQLRLWGEMGAGQPGEVVLQLHYRIARPTEELLQQSGWLHFCGIGQSQTGRASHPLMREATAERGIDPRLFYDNRFERRKLLTTGGVYLCDYDRDGILDVLITDVNRLALYHGLPDGKFVDVTEQVGLSTTAPPDHSLTLAAFVDLNGDGWEDLLLGTQVFRNEHGQRFVDVTDQTNLRLPESASGVALADYDRDGRMDIYVTRTGKGKASSWVDGRSGISPGNQLWRNKGNWQFEDVTAQSGTSGGNRSTFTAVWLDANNDGWPDLYVPCEFGEGVLLINQGDGTFGEHLLAQGSGDFGTMGLTCGDIDNDGNIDLYACNMYSKAGNRVFGNVRPGTYSDDIMKRLRQFVAGSQLHRNLGKLQFEQLGKKFQIAAVGWAYGAVLLDLDNDGWLDLYATCGFISASRTDPDG